MYSDNKTLEIKCNNKLIIFKLLNFKFNKI